MSDNDENKSARATQEEEMKKLGITPHSERVSKGKGSDSEDEDEDIEEEKEEEDNDDESEDEEDEDSEDEEEDEDKDEDEEDEEEEDEDEESQSHKKKGIPYKAFNELKRELRSVKKQLAEKGKSAGEEVSDDFDKRVDELAKEMQLDENGKEGIKKLTNLMKDVIKGTSSKYEEKLANLEKEFGKLQKDTPIKDDFEKEWKTFEKQDLRKQFPDASPEELEEAQKLMHKLSHTKGIGGKAYVDENGREMLDPYELEYVFFKNKSKFEEIMTGKKVKGMETSRTRQNLGREQKENSSKSLPKNASLQDIRAYEKRAAEAMQGMDNLSDPVDDTI